MQLKKNLINVLKEYPIDGPKDADYTFTKDFMLLLFRVLFTYQSIAKEIVKELNFQQRLEFLKTQDDKGYRDSIEKRNTAL